MSKNVTVTVHSLQRTMLRIVLVPATLIVGCLLIAGLVSAAEPVLPKGALARFGTDQFQHNGAIMVAQFALDGKAIVTSSQESTLRLWDAATGKELRRFELSGKPVVDPDLDEKELAKSLDKLGFKEGTDPVSVALILSQLHATVSPDGRLLAATRGGPVLVWEAATGKLLHELKLKEDADRPRLVIDIKFAPDGKTLAGVGTDLSTFSWDVASGKWRGSESEPNRTHLAKLIQAGGTMPVLTDDLSVLAWFELDSKRDKGILKRLDLVNKKNLPDVNAAKGGFDLWCLSPNGKTLVWHDPSTLEVIVCDLANPRKKKKLKPRDDDDVATALRFSPDGGNLAIRRYGRGLELWDLAKTKKVWRKPAILNFAGDDLYDLALGRETGTGLAFSPDGKSLAVSFGTARLALWDAVTGKPTTDLEAGHLGEVTILGLCQDGKALMTFSPGDGVRLWDAARGKNLACPLKLEHVWAASLSGDGRLLATIEQEGAELWDVATGKSLRKIPGGDNQFDALDLSPDGQTLALHAVEGWSVRLHSTATGKELCRTQVGEPFPEDGTGQPEMISALMVSDLVFSLDGRYLAGPGARQQLCVWHTATGILAWEAPLPPGQCVDTFTFTNRGLAVLFSDGGVAVYETATGRQRLRIESPNKDHSDDNGVDPYSVALALSPDGRVLAGSRYGAPITLRDLSTGREIAQVTGHMTDVIRYDVQP